MISLLINLIVYLLIVGILYWLVIYVVDAIPIPQPANRMIKILVAVLAVLVIVLMLLRLFSVDTGIDLPTVGVAPKP